MRRPLTLFMPPGERAKVDGVRRRLDPRQCASIPAHVTLCREAELVPWHAISKRLDELHPFRISMRFGEPEVLSDGCVLLRPTHGIEFYDQLRQSVLGPHAPPHGAHITLLHPRNAAGVEYDLASIGLLLAGLTATFSSVSLIEQRDDGAWVVQQEYGLPSSTPKGAQ